MKRNKKACGIILTKLYAFMSNYNNGIIIPQNNNSNNISAIYFQNNKCEKYRLIPFFRTPNSKNKTGKTTYYFTFIEKNIPFIRKQEFGSTLILFVCDENICMIDQKLFFFLIKNQIDNKHIVITRFDSSSFWINGYNHSIPMKNFPAKLFY